jgi:hypothetical protein
METFLFLEAGPSIVVHTSVPFSLQHLETDKEEMKDVIMSHLTQILPDLPQPTEIKSHKWRYSQVNLYIREQKSQVEIFSGKSLHQRTKSQVEIFSGKSLHQRTKSQVEIFSSKCLHQRTKVTSGDILR